MGNLRSLGSTGLDVHPLNLGANPFGWTADARQSEAVLDAYTAGGGNFIDTADLYGVQAPGNRGGESETIIGDWLAARGNRAEIVIATKVGMWTERPGLTPANINAGVEDSLRRLRTDYIDLYYTHRDDESVPVESIVTTLDALVKSGKVRAVAASNIGPERLEAALAFAAREGLTGYAAIQPHYNLVSRDTYEGELLAVAERYGLVALPYFGLASGFLTGKYRPGVAVDSARTGRVAGHLTDPRSLRVLAALDEVAAARGLAHATVALAWLAARPTVLAPIASARTPEQLPALLAVADVRLTAEETATLDAASA